MQCVCSHIKIVKNIFHSVHRWVKVDLWLDLVLTILTDTLIIIIIKILIFPGWGNKRKTPDEIRIRRISSTSKIEAKLLNIAMLVFPTTSDLLF